jgi:alkylhydroperoxidase family enzyme
MSEWASEDVVTALLTGRDELLEPRERALAAWAREVVSDPNGVEPADVAALRIVGFDDAQILAITTFVALRLAFATVNDALGARPDAALRTSTPAAVVDAVTYGRPIAD